MRICLVSQHYPPETALGGVGTQTWNKARALTRLDHTVHVLSCAAGPGPDLRSEGRDGVTVHRMQPPGQEAGRDFGVYEEQTYRLGYTWSVLRHLRGLAETVEFDVIDFPEYGAEGFAYQCDRGAANWVPVVVQLHAPLALLAERLGWPEKHSLLYQLGAFMEGQSICLADGLMACSAAIADFTAEHYGVGRGSISVVHCGVDAEAFRPGGGPDPADPNVLFVGNIAPSKGVVTAFEAVMRLRSEHPGVRLRIAGTGDEGLAAQIQEAARAAGAGDAVEFLGFVGREELPDLYRAAHAFCSPAQFEGGVANVFIEAMACGCPVVAGSAGGAPEAVEPGRTGFLVPPGDVEATAAALGAILRDRELRARLGRAARRRVEEYFAMDRYIGRVLSVYEAARERSRRKLREQEAWAA